MEHLRRTVAAHGRVLMRVRNGFGKRRHEREIEFASVG